MDLREIKGYHMEGVNSKERGQPYCNYCKKRNTDLLICGRCLSISNCGMACQRDDCKKHKYVCIRIDSERVKPLCRGDEGGEGAGPLPVRVIIPRDTRQKCKYLEEKDKEMGRGKEVFGQLIDPDELGWEDHSTDLRLNTRQRGKWQKVPRSRNCKASTTVV